MKKYNIHGKIHNIKCIKLEIFVRFIANRGNWLAAKKLLVACTRAFNSKHSIYRGNERGICNQIYTSSYVSTDYHRLIDNTWQP